MEPSGWHVRIRVPRATGPFTRPQCRRSHGLGFGLKSSIVVDCNTITHLHGRFNPARGLLHDMPGFVREMLLLPARHVNLISTGKGVRLQLRRPGGVVVDANPIQ